MDEFSSCGEVMKEFLAETNITISADFFDEFSPYFYLKSFTRQQIYRKSNRMKAGLDTIG